MRYGDLTYLEIKQLAEDGALVVLPTGCTEQQGPHLPVDLDSWFAEVVCLAAANRAADLYSIKALVLPAMPFGPTPEHRNFGSGFIDLSQELHEQVVSAILNSLFDQGFRRLVVWRGCGQHDLERVVAKFNAKYAGSARAFVPLRPYNRVWCRLGDPSITGGHADSFVTSISLYLRLESVRTSEINDPKSKPVDWAASDLDLSKYSPTGVIGDPTHASIELGAKLWHEVVEEVAIIFKELAEEPI